MSELSDDQFLHRRINRTKSKEPADGSLKDAGLAVDDAIRPMNDTDSNVSDSWRFPLRIHIQLANYLHRDRCAQAPLFLAFAQADFISGRIIWRNKNGWEEFSIEFRHGRRRKPGQNWTAGEIRVDFAPVGKVYTGR